MQKPLSNRSDEIEAAVLVETKSLLGVDDLSATDNFFDLGGHSILAARLLARLQPLVGQRAPLRLVFEADDLRELATRLADLAEQGSGR